MKRIVTMASLALALVLATTAQAAPKAEDVAKLLDGLNSQIEKSPDDPMLHYRKAQCLMALARYEHGYRAAKEAMEVFAKTGSSIPWMLLENIDLDQVNVDVHFNMGPKEKKPLVFGISRPLSFQVRSKGNNRAVLETIDFEIGWSGSKPMTAAMGQEINGIHANFGMLTVDATYEQIRTKAIALIKARHSKP